MQRLGNPAGMRNYSPSPASSATGGLFTTKSGAIDRVKLGLVVMCSLLALWVVYDLCSHIHRASFDDAVARARREMSRPGGFAGDAQAVGAVLRAPGSAEGKLTESLMFRHIDYQSTSFFNDAGVLANPVLPEHLVARQMNGLHVATIVPGQTRGNHMHTKHAEVIMLVHGRFLLRVAMLGNDGTWLSEDHVFEIGVPANPFSSVATTVSSVPLGLEIPADVCHAIRNIDETSTAFFISYTVLGIDAKREEPSREVCRNNPAAFLQ